MSSQEEKMSLNKKFIRCFCVPLSIGIFISLIISIVALNTLVTVISRDKRIVEIFHQVRKEKSEPVLANAIILISSVFQKYTNNIMKIRNFYLEFNKIVNYNENYDSTKIDLINRYLFNGYNDKEIEAVVKEYNLQEKDKKDFLSFRAKWYINPNVLSIEDADEQIRSQVMNQLYSVAISIPMLKSLFDLSSIDNELSIMFEDTEVFIEYPMNIDFINKEDLEGYDNPNICKTLTGEYPTYYYFKCRPYYYFLMDSVSSGINFGMSNIYKFGNGNIGITVCVHIPDFKYSNKNSKMDICQDLIINELKEELEKLNNLIEGYFFISKINSTYPIYYPNSHSQTDYEDIYNLEFDLNSEYFTDEINEFSNYIDNFTKPHHEDLEDSFQTFTLTKGGKKYQYFIYPIKIDFGDKEEMSPLQIFSLVYVHPIYSTIEINLNDKISNIFISILYIYLGGIMLLVLSKYFISSIATNITKPINKVRKMLDDNYDMSIEEEEFLTNEPINPPKILESFEDNPQKSEEIIPEVTNEEKESLIKKKKRKVVQLEKAKEEQLEEDEDDSDEESKNRSENLQKLFETLMEIKNTYKTLNDNKSNNSDKIPILVHSQNIFNEINNKEAYSACQSNIASLFIRDKQYDKAISHLICSIEKVNIKSYIDHPLDLKDKFKSERLTARYITLFFCYKQYFREIKHLNKNTPFPTKVLLIPHIISKYKEYINEFLLLARKINESKDLYLAILEKIEEQLMFNIKSNLEWVGRNYVQTEDKATVVKGIYKLFDELENLNEKINFTNYNVQLLINLLKYNDCIKNAFDMPPSILSQRANFLKAKFYLYCAHYQEAIEFFEKTVRFGAVGDVAVVIGSLKKMVKIAKFYYKLVFFELDIHKNDKRFNEEHALDEERYSKLKKFIYEMNEELVKYKKLL